MYTGARRLLILVCSARKRLDPDLLPAIDRYDGPAFRTLRRYLCSGPDEIPEIAILSAKYGLIPPEYPISAYDRPMTPERARWLAPHVQTRLTEMLDCGSYQDMFVCASPHYLRALDGALGVALRRLPLMVAEGPRGRRLSALRDWLYGAPPEAPVPPPRYATVRIRGIMVNLTAEQALAAARRALAAGDAGADRYQSWYVPVDGGRVAPKWLMTQLTGLSPGQFGTSEALRVLGQLGVTVKRA